MNKHSYINENGIEIYTSTYLKYRGTCCKSNCLHCPYGFTLKNYSIDISMLKEEQIKLANIIIRDTKPVLLCSVTTSLLNAGFGKEKVTEYHVTLDNFQNFALGKLKGEICAVIEYSTKLSESAGGRAISEVYLKKEFQDQGLYLSNFLK